MESLVLRSSPPTAYPPPEVGKLIGGSGFTGGINRNCRLSFANGYSSSFFPFSSSPRLRTSVIVAAKKDRKNSSNSKKVDAHNFIPKPDEATGPFPEAVLLKEKKVQEDGRLLPEFVDAEERELWEALELQLESDLNIDQMRHYEVVYLIHENHVEEVENVNLKVRDFIKEKKGKLWRFNDWGIRRLAYKIQKAKNAHYILMNFELEAKWINDFKSMLDKDERVIRHLVMKRDKAETKDCPPPPDFFALRGGMDEDDIDDDEDLDDEDTEDGIFYVDDDADNDKENRNRKPTLSSNMEKREVRAENVGR